MTIADDIRKAADCVEAEASDLLSDMSKSDVNELVPEMIVKASKHWRVTPQSIEHELARRQASRLITTLPRKVRNRIQT